MTEQNLVELICDAAKAIPAAFELCSRDWTEELSTDGGLRRLHDLHRELQQQARDLLNARKAAADAAQRAGDPVATSRTLLELAAASGVIEKILAEVLRHFAAHDIRLPTTRLH